MSACVTHADNPHNTGHIENCDIADLQLVVLSHLTLAQFSALKNRLGGGVYF